AAHEATGRAGEDLAAHRALARDLPGADHPLDFHCRLSRRDRSRLPVTAGLARCGGARSRRLLPLRSGERGTRQRSRSARSQRGERRALAPLHAAPAGYLGAAAQTQSRFAAASSQKAAAAAMRRRSMAWSWSRADGLYASARSRPSRSSARTPTTCTEPWLDIEAITSLRRGCQRHHLYDGTDQSRQLFLCNGECRREIDDRAKGADEYALVREACAQAIEIADMVELDRGDCSPHTNLLHPGKATAWRKAALERGGDR